MLNQVVLVGRLVKDVEVKELESGRKVANITLAIPRSFKNAEGEYETDFVDCVLWQGVAENTAEYCKKGDIVGVKGRIQTVATTNEESFVNGKELQIIAEKITFLSSKSEKNENN